MPRLVVLASGAGTTLQAIMDDPDLGPQIVAVGSDRPTATALERAAGAGIETFAVPFADYRDRGRWNREIEAALELRHPTLVVLAGFMRILDPQVVGRFRIVNTHPALLPAFPGAHAVRDALAAGARVTGVSVHWVDAGVDTGEVIAQERVRIEAGDDEDSLRTRLQAAEKPLYVQTLKQLCKQLG